MELFSAAGIDLPSTPSARARRARALARTLHTPLLAHQVVQDVLAGRGGARAFDPSRSQLDIAADYARKVRDPKFLKQKEMTVREMFAQEVVQALLGYTPFDPTRPYTVAREHSIAGGAVDLALGKFHTGQTHEIVAPFELKGPDTLDLDRVMPGRGRSPVQQAWDYAIDSPGSSWVLVSNCLEIRLYKFGRGRNAFERFDLTKLDEPDQLQRLWVILGAENFLEGFTDRLLADSDNAYRDVTAELYREYKALRGQLIGFLTNHSADTPRLEPLVALEIAQKLLDRVLFIAFAQRTNLMGKGLLEQAAREETTFAPQPLWRNFLGLFRSVDVGSPRHDIPPYNGGLFRHDPIADEIVIPDHLARDIARLGRWDYGREVPVTVLGHLFEQSITDIEELKAGAPLKVTKRKREGVVYTPDMVTRFLVERTIGLSLEQSRTALWAEHAMGPDAPTPSQIAFWRGYLAVLLDFTIVDPACGSGAFLVAAFDEMARRYRDAASALEALDVDIDFDVFDAIVTRNLHGVDLNKESVEITRLSLWLKTARRDHKLQDLEATIKDGNSLIADPAFTPSPFDWEASFPEVFARGGFDVVIGNPPYVRMEHLKEVKPYFSKHYVVADERTDLYAYFFEQGVRLLKAGGRLGYISSSTFFKTGSGANLRTFLTDGLTLEGIVDFGDLQIFEGVTTYPAILTLKKAPASDGTEVGFVAVRDKIPDDLETVFTRSGATMPLARLGKESWQLEGDALAALRTKIVSGRQTLGEVYGSPLYGIKTGLNEAFVIDRVKRDALIAADPKSADLLKPFLRGEDIKRWRVESQDLYLINTPRGAVDIEAYPAVRDHLAPFRAKLEGRATKQEWWELQQAQLAYQERLSQRKISFPHFQNHRMFALETKGAFSNDKSYFIPTSDLMLLSYLNSGIAWFYLMSMAPAVRNGWREMRVQYVQKLPIPLCSGPQNDVLVRLAEGSILAAEERHEIRLEVQHRILDLRAGNGGWSTNLENWHQLNFASFLAEIKKVFGVGIPPRERRDWELYLAENAAEVGRLSAEIVAAEREIDAVVYDLFALTPTEIDLLERSLGRLN